MSVGKLTRYSQPFANVVNSGVASASIVPGRTLENIKLKLAGTFTKAMITNIRIKANGKPIVDASGSEIDKMNAYRGETVNAAYLDIPFADYSLNNEFDRLVGAFDTLNGISNITAEVTIAGATAPVLTGILVESASQKETKGDFAPYSPLISKLLKYPFSMSTGGQLPLTVPFGPQSGAIIKRLHVVTLGGLMTGATVKQDGLVLHESVKAENEQEQVRFKRVPQSNFYTIDFVLDGAIKKALDTRDARSLEWLLTFSGADSGNVFVEYLDPLGNL